MHHNTTALCVKDKDNVIHKKTADVHCSDDAKKSTDKSHKGVATLSRRYVVNVVVIVVCNTIIYMISDVNGEC